MVTTDSAAVLKQIGRNVKAERARKDLTQEALAHLAGIAVAQLARMERGESDTGITKYVQIARAMKISAIALLQGVD